MALEVGSAAARSCLVACRDQGPLVICITNYVSMDFMANVLLAAGASPAMAHSIAEVEAFVGIASALLVNVGTLTDDWVASMKLAAAQAVHLGKPWVLDPVGCGATPYRTTVCGELLALKPTVVRGNASEILALAGVSGTVKGVDSTATASEALEAGRQLALRQGCIVAISGAEDLVTDGRRVLRAANGVPMLQQITATGCSVTALVAAFVSCFPQQPLEACAAALSYFGVAAELEAVDARGPGSLRVGLLDKLYSMTVDELAENARITED